MDWDVGAVHFTDVGVRDDLQNNLTAEDLRNRCKEFIKTYRDDNNFIYREQLIRNFNKNQLFIEIDLTHLSSYDQQLLDAFENSPNYYIDYVEYAAGDFLKEELSIRDPPPIQVLFKSLQAFTSIRNISSNQMNKLLKVPGIIISASKTRPKATQIHIKCRGCGHTQKLPMPYAFSPVQLPRNCQAESLPGKAPCGLDPYVIIPDQCIYQDQQTLKLQENPEEIPTGEIPRNILLSVNRTLVDKVSPGTRVNIIGIFSIFKSNQKDKLSSTIRTPYLQVIGLELESGSSNRMKISFTNEEEEMFHNMAKDKDLFTKLVNSIAPAITGDYTIDMKKAILCLLFGGSRKILPDGMKIRGDINVLFMGDPSTAKSQFLKFTESVAPIGVYTSGKGSSAAGLTASVIRDHNGEFYLEGGAMILGDGGVVCIDEFDKMRESDRVAIHEAMEQQTISIAKAGITTILNSRTSVLAAANPVYGHYDESKSTSDNIDFLPTILSRFDLVFIIKDIRVEERDREMARHILNIHKNDYSQNSSNNNNIYSTDILKKYIAYCRQTVSPRISPNLSNKLADQYQSIRQKALKDGNNSSIPITVRQLEAIIRISESLAKMRLLNEATNEHINEAIRLFNATTLNASNSNMTYNDTISFDMKIQIQRAEQAINRRIIANSKVSVNKLLTELENIGHNPYALRKAINILIQKGDFQHRDQQRNIVRIR